MLQPNVLQPTVRIVRPRLIIFILAIAAVALASCGSSDDQGLASVSENSGSDVAESDADAETGTDGDLDQQAEPVAAAEEAAPQDETSAEGSGSGAITVALADGRTWQMQGTCAFNPEASGPAAIVLDMVAASDDGAELNVLELWPLDGGQEKGTSFIASFTDELGVLYVLEQAAASGSGGSVTLETGLHQNPLYALGDAPDTTGSFTCSL